MSTMIIGKVLPDKQVRYIRCTGYETLSRTALILLRFYSRESRLDALLDLGNLDWLGATPYGNYIWDDDPVHCIARIRDRNHPNTEDDAEIMTDKGIFCKAQCPVYLFENGRWIMANQSDFVELNSPWDIVPFSRIHLFQNYSVIRYSQDTERSKENGKRKKFSFPDWNALTRIASEQNDTYYVFSGNRLVSCINPKHITQ